MTTKTKPVDCNLCHNNDTRLVCTKFGLNLVRCNACGLVYANPRLPETEIMQRYDSPLFFNQYLENLRATPSTYDFDFIRSHYHIFLGLIEQFFAPGKRLLDVGCGPGFFIKAAEEAGWKAEGIEISSAASEYANNIVRVPVHKGKLEELNLSSDTYDLVTLNDILEHLVDPLGTLKEIHRILKREGVVILNTPDFNSLNRLFLGNDWAVLSPAEHLYNFTQKTLMRMLSEANFQVLGVRNLLILNPEYTHDKSRRRYLRWKSMHERIEKMNAMENLHGFEYLDLLSINNKIAPEAPVPGFFKRMKRQVYKRAKRWIRGDILVAIGSKV